MSSILPAVQDLINDIYLSKILSGLIGELVAELYIQIHSIDTSVGHGTVHKDT